MKTLFLTFLGLSFCLLSASMQPASGTDSTATARWLIGSWQGTYQQKPFYEAWRKMNDSTLINLKIDIANGDTLVQENGVIRYTSKGTYFQTKEATWKLRQITNSSLLFGNDTLKFANQINWTHSKTDHWLTEIKGPKSTIKYDLQRVNWLDKKVDAYVVRAGNKR